MKFWYSVPLGLLFACLSTASQAQILIDQSAGFMYLDAVNAKGGIGGQKIELISWTTSSTRSWPMKTPALPRRTPKP